MATALLADVLIRDDDPAMRLRRSDHLLQQAAVGLLDLAALGKLAAHVAKPARERIANTLELAGGKQARATGGADAPIEALTGERRGERPAKLTLEPGDLAA